ncbi:MAG TPA: carboxypeptidase-like regulatory domain-containing protein, partial [Chryseolinea sp.]
MKMLFAIAALQVLLSIASQGQDLDQKVSISFRAITFEQVLSELTSQYDLKFSYSEDWVGLNKKINLSIEHIRLEDALQKIFKQAEVEYSVVGEQIVLRDKSNAEKEIVVRGKVMDGPTGTPLPLASVRLDETSIGVATNHDGAFILHIPAQHHDSKITVSYVGYQSYHFSCSPDKNAITIRLEMATTQLSTVVVTSKTGHSILKEAIARIHENYDTGKVIYTYFIRDLALQDGDPVEASETVYQAYRESTAPSADQQVKAVKGRRVKDFHAVQGILQTFIRWTGFEIGLSTDIIFSAELKTPRNEDEFPGANFLRQHDFELQGSSILDDKEVYVIS